jgi:hypothetical protein
MVSQSNLPTSGESKGSFSATPTVAFPGSAVVGYVDHLLADFYTRCRDNPLELCLDFSETDYLEIATLQLVTALVAQRKRDGLRTFLRLPAGKSRLKVRHFLRRWRYDDALEAATHETLETLSGGTDTQYFADSPDGDRGDPYAGVYVVYSDEYGEIVYPVEAYRFFEFTSWKIDVTLDKRSLLKKEKDRWSSIDATVWETIRRRLRKPRPIKRSTSTPVQVNPEQHLYSRIVFQTMTNALRHPDATIIQASSHLGSKRVPDNTVPNKFRVVENFFTIVYWDDGLSMYRTLKQAIADNHPIHFNSQFSARYLLGIYENGRPIAHQVVNSTEIPDSTTPDVKLLLATLFPGVTCDVRGIGQIKMLDPELSDEVVGLPGHGLYALVQAVTDVFGGTVAFRTADLFMNVDKLSHQRLTYLRQLDPSLRQYTGTLPDYWVKIDQFRAPIPEFLGNQITIRLPLDED